MDRSSFTSARVSRSPSTVSSGFMEMMEDRPRREGSFSPRRTETETEDARLRHQLGRRQLIPAFSIPSTLLRNVHASWLVSSRAWSSSPDSMNCPIMGEASAA